jgi:hypothetical protein
MILEVAANTSLELAKSTCDVQFDFSIHLLTHAVQVKIFLIFLHETI